MLLQIVKPPSDHTERLDASPERMREFRKVLREAKTSWFDQQYGDAQLNLLILATHPDYRRQGAGRKLVQWGLDKASDEGVALTLFSSPMGLKLYSKMKFREVNKARVQVQGEEESITIPGMIWEPPEKAPQQNKGQDGSWCTIL